MITVLVVDDEPLVRLSVRSLENWASLGFDLAYEAADGEAALALLAAHQDIDIVILDVDMPRMNGLTLAEVLAERGSGPAVLFLSSFDTFDFARRAFKAGARDYILKSEMDDGRLLEALRRLVAQRDSGAPGSSERSRTQEHAALFSGLLAGSTEPGEPEDLGFRAVLPVWLLALKPADSRLVADRYGDDPAAFTRIVSDLLSQCIGPRPSGESLTLSFDRYVCLFSSREDAERTLEELNKAAWNYIGLTFEGRIEGPISEWALVREAYIAADSHFSSASRLVVRARRYIRDHYADPDLDLAAIAAYVEVSKNHLSWEFTRETGETVSSFIASVRVEAAKKLLAETALKTYEIAERVGYLNVETFCRAFKKVTGSTPRSFPS